MVNHVLILLIYEDESSFSEGGVYAVGNRKKSGCALWP